MVVCVFSRGEPWGKPLAPVSGTIPNTLDEIKERGVLEGGGGLEGVVRGGLLVVCGNQRDRGVLRDRGGVV